VILFDELSKFYNSKTSRSNSIFSFAYHIRKINFSSLLNSLQKTRKKIFYWSNSDMEFTGIGDLFNVCNYKNSNFETTISQLSRNHVNNFN